MRTLRARLSFANVISLIALFVALGGTSYGLASGAIDSREIKNNTVRTKDVRNGSLLSRDFKAGQLPAGSRGATGPAGPAGRSALSALTSGETMRGVWAISSDAAAGSTQVSAIPFPVPAPQQVDSAHAVVAGNDVVDGNGCTGTAAAPVAGRGFVCAYASATSGTLNTAAGFGIRSTAFAFPAAANDGSPFGFALVFNGTGTWRAYGTWAYTAP